MRRERPRNGRGRRAPRPAALVGLGLALVAAACGYSFRSPVPPHLDTVYVPTFENETREFQITQQLTERVVSEFLNESRLRLVGDEADADLVVRGTILRYEEEALAYDPGREVDPDVFTRRVVLTVDLRLEDRVREETLWEAPSHRQWGEFNEEAGETVDLGIERAIEKIAEEILRNVIEEF